MSEAKPQKPAIPVWHCDFKPIAGDGLPQITVGTKFGMECAGDLAVHWSGQPKIELPEKTPSGSLQILSVGKLEENSASFVVTSYRAGQFKPGYVRVTTGEQGFEASGLEFTVQSVLKQNQQQPQQPYGPFGPFALPLPFWVWLAVALVLASICAGIWIWFQNIQYRRRLADARAEFGRGGLNPSAQFHRDIRHLARKIQQAQDTAAAEEWDKIVDMAVRVYLLREYNYLTIKVPRATVYAGLRAKNSHNEDDPTMGLTKLYSELDRFRSHAAQHKPAEFDQILKIAQAWCDRLEKEKVRRA